MNQVLHSSRTFGLSGIVMIVVACVCAMFVTLTPGEADACSQIPPGWYDAGLAQPVPSGGVIVLRSYAVRRSSDDLDELEFQVRDSQGDELDGTLESIVLREDVYFGLSSGDRILVVWRPAQPLTAGAYVVDYTYISSLNNTQQSASKKIDVVDADDLALQQPEIVSSSIQQFEWLSDYRCCEVEENECACGECTRCWPTAYAYFPKIAARIDGGQSELMARQTYLTVEANGVEQDKFFVSSGSEREMSATFVDMEAPYCLTITATSLIDGSTVASEEDCFDEDDLAPYLPREFPTDEHQPPAECASGDSEQPATLQVIETGEDVLRPGETDNGETDNGDGGEAPGDGASDGNAGADGAMTTGSEGCGCNSAGGALPGSAVGLSLMALVLYRRRQA